jgi:hypothetical protein
VTARTASGIFYPLIFDNFCGYYGYSDDERLQVICAANKFEVFKFWADNQRRNIVGRNGHRGKLNQGITALILLGGKSS